jgi:predicted DCC family thiol-disulfide oxidoreductase YuxK
MEISETGHAAVDTLLVYDGQCSFCKDCVHFVKRNSVSGRFSFLDFHQSDDSFRQWLMHHGIKQFNSVIYVEGGKISCRSTAVLKIFKRMNYPFRLLYAFIIIPAFIRDGLYNLIAGNRARFSTCSASGNP